MECTATDRQKLLCDPVDYSGYAQSWPGLGSAAEQAGCMTGL